MTTDQIPSTDNIEDRLEATYAEYQQQHRYERLDDIAEVMEQTLVQRELATALFDDDFEVDDDIVDNVQEIKEHVARNAITELTDEQIETVKRELTEEERELSETIRAFTKLNDQLGFMDGSRLTAVKELLDNWDWESIVPADDDATLEAKLDAAAETGEIMADAYTEAQQALGQEFSGTQIQDIVDQLLNEDSFPIENLNAEEMQALGDSVVGPYLQLTLSDRE